MNWPSLSILIPSFNQGHYIERTILSILQQNYPGDLQIVVSDGGSKDSTVEVLKKYPQITWWSEPDKGFADAVNKALAVARGEIVAIQSSDDFYLKGAFDTAIRVLVERQDLGFVTGGDVLVYDDAPMKLGSSKSRLLRNPADLLIVMGIAQHATFVRREAIDKVDGLRDNVDQCADFDLWYRVLHFYQGLMLPDYLAAYQIHSAQRTQSMAQLWVDSLCLVVESCKADEKYAREFTVPDEVYKEFRKSMELFWNKIAGGEEGLEIRKRIAQEIISDGDIWSENLRNEARAIIRESGEEDSLLTKLREKTRVRTRLRQLVNRRQSSASEEDRQRMINIDVDWWRNKEL